LGVLQVRRDADLAQEALGPEHGAELRVEDLDGHGAVVPDVARQVHGRHAAAAEHARQLVALGEGRRESRVLGFGRRIRAG
jgi:hypothetical protein